MLVLDQSADYSLHGLIAVFGNTLTIVGRAAALAYDGQIND